MTLLIINEWIFIDQFSIEAFSSSMWIISTLTMTIILSIIFSSMTFHGARESVAHCHGVQAISMQRLQRQTWAWCQLDRRCSLIAALESAYSQNSNQGFKLKNGVGFFEARCRNHDIADNTLAVTWGMSHRSHKWQSMFGTYLPRLISMLGGGTSYRWWYHDDDDDVLDESWPSWIQLISQRYSVKKYVLFYGIDWTWNHYVILTLHH